MFSSIISSLWVYTALATFVVNAVSLDASSFAFDDPVTWRLLRVSPLVCIHETIWDLLQILASVPHPAPSGEYWFGLEHSMSTQSQYITKRFLFSLVPALAIGILASSGWLWSKAFTVIWLLHWLIKELRAHQIIDQDSQDSPGPRGLTSRPALVQYTRGLFVGITYTFLTYMFKCDIWTIIPGLCLACAIGSLSTGNVARENPDAISSNLIAMIGYVNSILVLMLLAFLYSEIDETSGEHRAAAFLSIYACVAVILLLEFPPHPSRTTAKLFFGTTIALFILGYEASLFLRIFGLSDVD